MCARTAVTTPAARPSRRSRTAAGLQALGAPDDPGPLFDVALTHRSFAFESPESGTHNERLEFLGDAILGAVVTDLIYDSYPDLDEGDMARLRASVVNTTALAGLSREVGLADLVKLGKGEEASGGRGKDSILANVFEAVVGAVYVETDIETVRRALVPIFAPMIAASLEGGRYDAKTALQETSVRETGDLPEYRVASSGPDHDKRYDAHVYVAGRSFGSGTGRSKKEAEQNAAREALARLDRDPGGSADEDPPAASEVSDARAS